MNNTLLLAAVAFFAAGWFCKSVSTGKGCKAPEKPEPLKSFDGDGVLGWAKTAATNHVKSLEEKKTVLAEDVKYCNFLIDSFERVCKNYEGAEDYNEMIEKLRKRVAKLKVVEEVKKE